jgi:hypothetical protein
MAEPLLRLDKSSAKGRRLARASVRLRSDNPSAPTKQGRPQAALIDCNNLERDMQIRLRNLRKLVAPEDRFPLFLIPLW